MNQTGPISIQARKPNSPAAVITESNPATEGQKNRRAITIDSRPT